jgi:hypothetical protein
MSGQTGPVPGTSGAGQLLSDQTNELQQALRTDGYAIVRNVLKPEEVRLLRGAAMRYLKASDCYNYGGKFRLVEREKVPDIETIIASDSVRRHLARATEPLAFRLTDICDLALNTTSQWHKDVAHFNDVDGHAFTDEGFRFYKIAFYLQEQDETSPATLRVRPGSHLSRDLTDLPVKKAVVSAGDMIIFDVRIDHLGQLTTVAERMLRMSFVMAGARLHFDAQKAFSQSRSIMRWFHPHTSDRVAIFMTFGPCRTGDAVWEHSDISVRAAPAAQ